MLEACVDDSYRGRVDPLLYDDYDFTVKVAIGKDRDMDGTKGSGPLADDGNVAFDGRSIYVYAFIKDGSADFRTLSADDSERCLVDASKDTEGSPAGKKAILRKDIDIADWVGPTVSYYPRGEKMYMPYNFFAYHIDDIEPEESDFHRAQDSITLDLTIDGAQDIMTSYAEAQDKMSQMDSLYSFSYYTAQKGFMPTFKFNHNLVRLNVKIKGGYVATHCKELSLQYLAVLSQTRASLTVAHRDSSRLGIRFSGDSATMEYLPLAEADGTELQEFAYKVHTRMEESEPAEQVDVGGALLVADNIGGFRCRLRVAEIRGEEVIEPFDTLSLAIPPPRDKDGFECGKEYNVAITLNGYMDVTVETQLKEWEDGGSADITEEPDRPSRK